MLLRPSPRSTTSAFRQPVPVTSRPSPPLKLYAGVFLISLASLALEVLQMRIFAFSLWHHLAFLVVSIAILGFGAAGAFLSVVGPLRDAHLGRSVAIAGLLFAGSAFLGPRLLADQPIDVFDRFGAADILRTGLYYLVFALPYFFAGYIVSIALTQEPESAAKLYFANMVGSGVGCFVLFALLAPLGAPGTLVVIAALGALVAALAPCGVILRGLGVLAVLGCLSILPGINEHVRPLVDPLLARLPELGGEARSDHPHRLLSADEWFRFRPARSKLIHSYTETFGQQTLATRWSPLGRIDIVEDPQVSGAVLLQDGDAPGQMPAADHVFPEGQIHGISYVIRDEPAVLIIGIGGGLDVKIARDKGARSITAVEINSQSLELYAETFKELTGDPASWPNVELHAAEGRHFIRSHEGRYDLIQMSGVDTYTALANGAYVLSESYLYTEEAFHDYLDHLEDDGLLTIIRFAFPAPRETLRILVIASQVLRERGAADPWRHLALLLNSDVDEATRLGAILLKRTPFTAEETGKLAAWAEANDYAIKVLPGRQAAKPFRELIEGDPQRFLASYPYDVRPVTDDRPFFFSQHRWSAVWKWIREREKQQLPPSSPWVAITKEFQYRPVGLLLLLLTLVQLAVLVAICIFGPLFFIRRSVRGPSTAPLGYFLSLGLGYIFLMISAMQRFSLVLGHPSYSVTITMATFLIGSGLGSLASGRWPVRRAVWLVWLAALVVALSAYVLHAEMPALARTMLGWSFAARVLATVGLLLPMVFVMGMCFPTGVRVLAESRGELIPWAYGVNGAASVLASVLTVILAMEIGFSRVHWVAAALYVLAACLIVPMARADRLADRDAAPDESWLV